MMSWNVSAKMQILPEIASVIGDIDFDPEVLHEKYLFERDKRLESGVRDYIEVKADFSRYVDDPYVEPGFTRAPVFDEVECAIIGGGFGDLRYWLDWLLLALITGAVAIYCSLLLYLVMPSR